MNLQLFGSLLGFLFAIISAMFGLISAKFAGVIFIAVQYALFFIVFLLNAVTKPNKTSTIADVLPSSLFSVYRKYHLFLRFTSFSIICSALLNALRLNGFLFSAAMIYSKEYWIVAPLAGFFFISGMLILALDPVMYMKDAALRGNEIAREELARINAVASRMEFYH